MKFNKNKSVIMFHKGANYYRYEEEVYELKKVDVSKVLGY